MVTIETVANEMGQLDATHISSEKAIAYYILRNLKAYKNSDKRLPDDAEFIAVAIQAYAKIIQDAGVKII